MADTVAKRDSCGNCLFFDRRAVNKNTGSCRRYPPTSGGDSAVLAALTQIHWIISKGMTEYSDEGSDKDFNPEMASSERYGEFPLVLDEDWCGEFRAKVGQIAAMGTA